MAACDVEPLQVNGTTDTQMRLPLNPVTVAYLAQLAHPPDGTTENLQYLRQLLALQHGLSSQVELTRRQTVAQVDSLAGPKGERVHVAPQDVAECWRWLTEAQRCGQAQLQQAAEYHQFYHELHDVDAELVKQGNLQPVHIEHATVLSVADALQDATSARVALWMRMERLVTRSRTVRDVRLLQTGQLAGVPAHLLCSFRSHELTLQLGERVQLLENVDSDYLRVRTFSGRVGVVPRLCCLVDAPDIQAAETCVVFQKRLVNLWQREHQQTLLACIAYFDEQLANLSVTDEENVLNDAERAAFVAFLQDLLAFVQNCALRKQQTATNLAERIRKLATNPGNPHTDNDHMYKMRYLFNAMKPYCTYLDAYRTQNARFASESQNHFSGSSFINYTHSQFKSISQSVEKLAQIKIDNKRDIEHLLGLVQQMQARRTRSRASSTVRVEHADTHTHTHASTSLLIDQHSGAVFQQNPGRQRSKSLDKPREAQQWTMADIRVDEPVNVGLVLAADVVDEGICTENSLALSPPITQMMVPAAPYVKRKSRLVVNLDAQSTAPYAVSHFELSAIPTEHVALDDAVSVSVAVRQNRNVASAPPARSLECGVQCCSWTSNMPVFFSGESSVNAQGRQRKAAPVLKPALVNTKCQTEELADDIDNDDEEINVNGYVQTLPPIDEEEEEPTLRKTQAIQLIDFAVNTDRPRRRHVATAMPRSCPLDTAVQTDADIKPIKMLTFGIDALLKVLAKTDSHLLRLINNPNTSHSEQSLMAVVHDDGEQRTQIAHEWHSLQARLLMELKSPSQVLLQAVEEQQFDFVEDLKEPMISHLYNDNDQLMAVSQSKLPEDFFEAKERLAFLERDEPLEEVVVTDSVQLGHATVAAQEPRTTQKAKEIAGNSKAVQTLANVKNVHLMSVNIETIVKALTSANFQHRSNEWTLLMPTVFAHHEECDTPTPSTSTSNNRIPIDELNESSPTVVQLDELDTSNNFEHIDVVHVPMVKSSHPTDRQANEDNRDWQSLNGRFLVATNSLRHLMLAVEEPVCGHDMKEQYDLEYFNTVQFKNEQELLLLEYIEAKERTSYEREQLLNEPCSLNDLLSNSSTLRKPQTKQPAIKSWTCVMADVFANDGEVRAQIARRHRASAVQTEKELFLPQVKRTEWSHLCPVIHLNDIPDGVANKPKPVNSSTQTESDSPPITPYKERSGVPAPPQTKNNTNSASVQTAQWWISLQPDIFTDQKSSAAQTETVHNNNSTTLQSNLEPKLELKQTVQQVQAVTVQQNYRKEWSHLPAVIHIDVTPTNTVATQAGCSQVETQSMQEFNLTQLKDPEADSKQALEQNWFHLPAVVHLDEPATNTVAVQVEVTQVEVNSVPELEPSVQKVHAVNLQQMHRQDWSHLPAIVHLDDDTTTNTVAIQAGPTQDLQSMPELDPTVQKAQVILVQRIYHQDWSHLPALLHLDDTTTNTVAVQAEPTHVELQSLPELEPTIQKAQAVVIQRIFHQDWLHLPAVVHLDDTTTNTVAVQAEPELEQASHDTQAVAKERAQNQNWSHLPAVVHLDDTTTSTVAIQAETTQVELQLKQEQPTVQNLKHEHAQWSQLPAVVHLDNTTTYSVAVQAEPTQVELPAEPAVKITRAVFIQQAPHRDWSHLPAVVHLDDTNTTTNTVAVQSELAQVELHSLPEVESVLPSTLAALRQETPHRDWTHLPAVVHLDNTITNTVAVQTDATEVKKPTTTERTVQVDDSVIVQRLIQDWSSLPASGHFDDTTTSSVAVQSEAAETESRLLLVLEHSDQSVVTQSAPHREWNQLAALMHLDKSDFVHCSTQTELEQAFLQTSTQTTHAYMQTEVEPKYKEETAVRWVNLPAQFELEKVNLGTQTEPEPGSTQLLDQKWLHLPAVMQLDKSETVQSHTQTDSEPVTSQAKRRNWKSLPASIQLDYKMVHSHSQTESEAFVPLKPRNDWSHLVALIQLDDKENRLSCDQATQLDSNELDDLYEDTLRTGFEKQRAGKIAGGKASDLIGNEVEIEKHQGVECESQPMPVPVHKWESMQPRYLVSTLSPQQMASAHQDGSETDASDVRACHDFENLQPEAKPENFVQEEVLEKKVGKDRAIKRGGKNVKKPRADSNQPPSATAHSLAPVSGKPGYSWTLVIPNVFADDGRVLAQEYGRTKQLFTQTDEPQLALSQPSMVQLTSQSCDGVALCVTQQRDQAVQEQRDVDLCALMDANSSIVMQYFSKRPEQLAKLYKSLKTRRMKPFSCQYGLALQDFVDNKIQTQPKDFGTKLCQMKPAELSGFNQERATQASNSPLLRSTATATEPHLLPPNDIKPTFVLPTPTWNSLLPPMYATNVPSLVHASVQTSRTPDRRLFAVNRACQCHLHTALPWHSLEPTLHVQLSQPRPDAAAQTETSPLVAPTSDAASQCQLLSNPLEDPVVRQQTVSSFARADSVAVKLVPALGNNATQTDAVSTIYHWKSALPTVYAEDDTVVNTTLRPALKHNAAQTVASPDSDSAAKTISTKTWSLLLPIVFSQQDVQNERSSPTHWSCLLPASDAPGAPHLWESLPPTSFVNMDTTGNVAVQTSHATASLRHCATQCDGLTTTTWCSLLPVVHTLGQELSEPDLQPEQVRLKLHSPLVAAERPATKQHCETAVQCDTQPSPWHSLDPQTLAFSSGPRPTAAKRRVSRGMVHNVESRCVETSCIVPLTNMACQHEAVRWPEVAVQTSQPANETQKGDKMRSETLVGIAQTEPLQAVLDGSSPALIEYFSTRREELVYICKALKCEVRMPKKTKPFACQFGLALQDFVDSKIQTHPKDFGTKLCQMDRWLLTDFCIEQASQAPEERFLKPTATMTNDRLVRDQHVTTDHEPPPSRNPNRNRATQTDVELIESRRRFNKDRTASRSRSGHRNARCQTDTDSQPAVPLTRSLSRDTANSPMLDQFMPNDELDSVEDIVPVRAVQLQSERSLQSEASPTTATLDVACQSLPAGQNVSTATDRVSMCDATSEHDAVIGTCTFPNASVQTDQPPPASSIHIAVCTEPPDVQHAAANTDEQALRSLFDAHALKLLDQRRSLMTDSNSQTDTAASERGVATDELLPQRDSATGTDHPIMLHAAANTDWQALLRSNSAHTCSQTELMSSEHSTSTESISLQTVAANTDEVTFRKFLDSYANDWSNKNRDTYKSLLRDVNNQTDNPANVQVAVSTDCPSVQNADVNTDEQVFQAFLEVNSKLRSKLKESQNQTEQIALVDVGLRTDVPHVQNSTVNTEQFEFLTYVTTCASLLRQMADFASNTDEANVDAHTQYDSPLTASSATSTHQPLHTDAETLTLTAAVNHQTTMHDDALFLQFVKNLSLTNPNLHRNVAVCTERPPETQNQDTQFDDVAFHEYLLTCCMMFSGKERGWTRRASSGSSNTSQHGEEDSVLYDNLDQSVFEEYLLSLYGNRIFEHKKAGATLRLGLCDASTQVTLSSSSTSSDSEAGEIHRTDQNSTPMLVHANIQCEVQQHSAAVQAGDASRNYIDSQLQVDSDPSLPLSAELLSNAIRADLNNAQKLVTVTMADRGFVRDVATQPDADAAPFYDDLRDVITKRREEVQRTLTQIKLNENLLHDAQTTCDYESALPLPIALLDRAIRADIKAARRILRQVRQETRQLLQAGNETDSDDEALSIDQLRKTIRKSKDAQLVLAQTLRESMSSLLRDVPTQVEPQWQSAVASVFTTDGQLAAPEVIRKTGSLTQQLLDTSAVSYSQAERTQDTAISPIFIEDAELTLAALQSCANVDVQTDTPPELNEPQSGITQDSVHILTIPIVNPSSPLEVNVFASVGSPLPGGLLMPVSSRALQEQNTISPHAASFVWPQSPSFSPNKLATLEGQRYRPRSRPHISSTSSVEKPATSALMTPSAFGLRHIGTQAQVELCESSMVTDIYHRNALVQTVHTEQVTESQNTAVMCSDEYVQTDCDAPQLDEPAFGDTVDSALAITELSNHATESYEHGRTTSREDFISIAGIQSSGIADWTFREPTSVETSHDTTVGSSVDKTKKLENKMKIRLFKSIKMRMSEQNERTEAFAQTDVKVANTPAENEKNEYFKKLPAYDDTSGPVEVKVLVNSSKSKSIITIAHTLSIDTSAEIANHLLAGEDLSKVPLADEE